MDFTNSGVQFGLFTFLFILTIAIVGLYIYIKETNKKITSSNGSNADTNKLKLQAYERLTVFTERASLKNLVSRTATSGLTVVDAQLIFLDTLKAEYEYNVSQQIYVADDMWKAITNLKDQNTYIINQLAATLPSNENGIELSKRILEYTANNNNAELSPIVLEALRYEAKKIL
jgi:nucleoside diphosphate kinase